MWHFLKHARKFSCACGFRVSLLLLFFFCRLVKSSAFSFSQQRPFTSRDSVPFLREVVDFLGSFSRSLVRCFRKCATCCFVAVIQYDGFWCRCLIKWHFSIEKKKNDLVRRRLVHFDVLYEELATVSSANTREWCVMNLQGMIISSLAAMSTLHPESNPALAGQDIYANKELRNKQIHRLLGAMPTISAAVQRHREGRYCTVLYDDHWLSRSSAIEGQKIWAPKVMSRVRGRS